MTVSLRITILLAIAAAVLTGCGGKGAKEGAGTFTDTRDGKVYRTVSIGNRVWMAENLNYKGDGENALGRCYEDKEENCAKYGRLYPLYESKEICPAGWRLPIDADWVALRDAAGGDKAGKKLKSPAGWKDNGNGTDAYGFAALPGGFGGWDRFGEAGESGYWWSATLSDISDAVSVLSYFRMQFNEDYVGGGDEYGDGARYFSVRCVRESDDKEVKAALEADAKQTQKMSEDNDRRIEEMEAEAEAEQLRQAEEDLRYEEAQNARMAKESITTFTDSRDGKTYKQVTIGGQNWMAENLNYAAESSACYENNGNNCAKYGRLYNWGAAKQACPDGWHLSTDDEWTALEDAVGGRDIAGTKLKSTAGWNNKGNKADDYGFTALPGGYGDSNRDYFSDAGDDGYWWSATESNVGGAGAWSRLVNYSNEFVYRSNEGKAKQFSVRCVQDQEQN